MPTLLHVSCRNVLCPFSLEVTKGTALHGQSFFVFVREQFKNRPAMLFCTATVPRVQNRNTRGLNVTAMQCKHVHACQMSKAESLLFILVELLVYTLTKCQSHLGGGYHLQLWYRFVDVFPTPHFVCKRDFNSRSSLIWTCLGPCKDATILSFGLVFSCHRAAGFSTETTKAIASMPRTICAINKASGFPVTTYISHVEWQNLC